MRTPEEDTDATGFSDGSSVGSEGVGIGYGSSFSFSFSCGGGGGFAGCIASMI